MAFFDITKNSIDRVIKSKIKYENSFQKLSALIHSIFIDYQFINIFEEPSNVPGFAPSLRDLPPNQFISKDWIKEPNLIYLQYRMKGKPGQFFYLTIQSSLSTLSSTSSSSSSMNTSEDEEILVTFTQKKGKTNTLKFLSNLYYDNITKKYKEENLEELIEMIEKLIQSVVDFQIKSTSQPIESCCMRYKEISSVPSVSTSGINVPCVGATGVGGFRNKENFTSSYTPTSPYSTPFASSASSGISSTSAPVCSLNLNKIDLDPFKIQPKDTKPGEVSVGKNDLFPISGKSVGDPDGGSLIGPSHSIFNNPSFEPSSPNQGLPSPSSFLSPPQPNPSTNRSKSSSNEDWVIVDPYNLDGTQPSSSGDFGYQNPFPDDSSIGQLPNPRFDPLLPPELNNDPLAMGGRGGRGQGRGGRGDPGRGRGSGRGLYFGEPGNDHFRPPGWN